MTETGAIENKRIVGVRLTVNALDKARAVAGARRTAEAWLLLLAALGGTIGAYAARRLLRHKTRKQPFVRRLHTIAGMQLAAALAKQLKRRTHLTSF